MTRQIVCTSTQGVEAFAEVATDFMQRIFDLEPGDYLITDESTLGDFVPPGQTEVNMETVLLKISDTYHIGMIPANLLAIFRELPPLRRQ